MNGWFLSVGCACDAGSVALLLFSSSPVVAGTTIADSPSFFAVNKLVPILFLRGRNFFSVASSVVADTSFDSERISTSSLISNLEGFEVAIGVGTGLRVLTFSGAGVFAASFSGAFLAVCFAISAINSFFLKDSTRLTPKFFAISLNSGNNLPSKS